MGSAYPQTQTNDEPLVIDHSPLFASKWKPTSPLSTKTYAALVIQGAIIDRTFALSRFFRP
jgi:hypothetical protein